MDIPHDIPYDDHISNVYGNDLMSKLFLNIPDLMSFSANDITHAVESITVPVQQIHIEAMEFQNALEKGFVPPLKEEVWIM